ncbi:response regulator [Desulfobacter latus]|uniref:Response regulator n=1 Tax=Desulfobacter latus TaxID=2292 RepID=A0A850SSA9_9BACT|nr:response regulator [Desulfobacter latus]NWH04294.1 response regulator [Desulfobacter latus]
MVYSILIVDDSLPMRSVIKKTLGAAGYGGSEILEAENGQAALEMMRHNWVDVVLTDYNMPVMNGLDFILKAKKEEMLRDIPFIVVSTEGNKDRIAQFMESGAAGYVTKPFTAESIRDVMVPIIGEVDDEDTIDESDDDLDF